MRLFAADESPAPSRYQGKRKRRSGRAVRCVRVGKCAHGENFSVENELLRSQIKLASEMWPEDPTAAGQDGQEDNGSDSDEDGKPSLEEQIAREVSAMKRPKRESRFGMFYGS